MNTHPENPPNNLTGARIPSTERTAMGISDRNRLVVGGGFLRRLDAPTDTPNSYGPSMDTDSHMPPSCLRVVATGVAIAGTFALLGAVIARSMD